MTIVEFITAAGVFGALVALIWQFGSFKREQQTSLREETLPFFRAWWGAEFWLEGEHTTVKKLRSVFYKIVGSPDARPENTILAQLGQSLKQSPFGLGQVGNRIEQLIKEGKITFVDEQTGKPEDVDSLRKLTFFFDMIGWLGSHRLIDVEYILGPMQHTMRRTWWVAKPLILTDRQLRNDSWLDPVRHYGFEWLFEYSEKRHQADIIRSRFSGAGFLTRYFAKFLGHYQREANFIFDKKDIVKLMKNIDDDEAQFRAHLRKAGWPVDD